MSTMVTAVYRAFRAAGVEDDVAQAAAEAVPSADATLTRADLAGIQTEIAHFRTTVETELAKLRPELHAMEARFDTELAKLRTDLHAGEARLAWRVSTIVVSALLAATGMFAVIVNWVVRP